MNVENVSISSLTPYARNSRTHSDSQIDQIVSSIKEFGWTNPILVDDDNGIIAGHGRYLAAKKLGMENVPTIKLSHLTDAQKRAYVIADNQLALNAGWDEDLLASELSWLREEDFDIDLIGFSDSELEDLLPDSFDDPTEDEGSFGYSRKIESPIYTPKGDKPEINDMIDTSKTLELIDKIDNSDIPLPIKDFLRHAAGRHSVFNYEAIAEFYAHSSKEIQELFEDSALVIVDFKKSIESGFFKLCESIADQYNIDDEDCIDEYS